jgi:hypothetical protein
VVSDDRILDQFFPKNIGPLGYSGISGLSDFDRILDQCFPKNIGPNSDGIGARLWKIRCFTSFLAFFGYG